MRWRAIAGGTFIFALISHAQIRNDMSNQKNETDYNHLHRRWEARGWHYWYEHRADGHTLWLADDSSLAELIDGEDGGMRFHAGFAHGQSWHSLAGRRW